jgi:hypothetical protein
MTTFAVHMFAADNEYSYLVGYYPAQRGESVAQLLDRVAQATGCARQHLNVR